MLNTERVSCTADRRELIDSYTGLDTESDTGGTTLNEDLDNGSLHRQTSLWHPSVEPCSVDPRKPQ